MSEHTVKLYYDVLRELASVKIERDALAAMLKELQAENVELRKCVELYANENNWAFSAMLMSLVYWKRTFNGYEPAQKCLARLRPLTERNDNA